MTEFLYQPAESYINAINAQNFDGIALQLFRLQYSRNAVYKAFVDALRVDITTISNVTEIPFLPISFFKTHDVVCGTLQTGFLVFKSSTTTSDIPARHYVPDSELYLQSLLAGFRQYYGNPADYTILALLPSYLKREGASLVYMAEQLMQESKQPLNGFYLDEFEKLHSVLNTLEQQGKKAILIGVTFALLDFFAAYPMQMHNTIVMETGGMKGRRKEQTREEVQNFLKQQCGVSAIHSEYGMTELLSQAYSPGNGIFHATKTMKIFARDMNDPFELRTAGAGCINVIDLANVHSCAFIATDDITNIAPDGSFEVLGRADNSALRGCNLMVV